MTARQIIRRFRRAEDGSTIVEFAIVLPVFLLIFFMLIDFGRMAFHYVNSEKSMQVAARVAAVRPAACPGVPDFNRRGPTEIGETAPRTGVQCNTGANVCQAVGTITCTGDPGHPTVAEIWGLIDGALPNDAGPENMQFSYAFDPDLGFLGGPYVPVVTVEITGLEFDFVNPLGVFVALAGGGRSTAGATIPFPSLSVSLPAEDLAQGDAG